MQITTKIGAVKMDEKHFLDVCCECLKDMRMDDLETEKIIQIRIANALLDDGLKAFCEYPYPDGKDECDIVLTESLDCMTPLVWIEIKPVWKRRETNYFSASKFIKEGPFKKDIEKLFRTKIQNKHQKRWFLLVLDKEEMPKMESVMIDAPKARQGLTSAQMMTCVNLWAGNLAPVKMSIPGTDIGLLLWSIEKYDAEAIATEPDSNGNYKWKR